MKLFTTDKILVELTKEDLECLDIALNSAYIRLKQKEYPEYFIDQVFDLWVKVTDIEKSLPF